MQLHEKSFSLHAGLAKELDIKSFRYLPTVSASSSSKKRNEASNASWLDGHVKVSTMDAGSGTAQVTPGELVSKMVSVLEAGGSEVMIDTVTGVVVDSSTKRCVINGVHTVGHGIVAADKVVFCMGPWTGALLQDWLSEFEFTLPMEGVKSTSLVYRNVEQTDSQHCAVFGDEDVNGCHLEIYPRPGGEVYVCGCGGSDHVSGDRLLEGGDCCSADLIKADPLRALAAHKSLCAMTSIGQIYQPDLSQACMRPCTTDGLPVMSEIPEVAGAFISAGHNCWGILWAPICGVAMAELVVDGTCSCLDLKPFSVERFDRSGKVRQRGRKKGLQDVGEQW